MRGQQISARHQRRTEKLQSEEPIQWAALCWSRVGSPNKKPQSDARYSNAPLRLLIRLSLRAAHDFQSLSVIFKHLREAGRILAQRLNRVKKKSQSCCQFGPQTN